MTLEGVVNFRDVGGHSTADGRRVRLGRLYRSGHFGKATDSDLRALADLGLRTVIDFRGPGDIEWDGESRLPVALDHVALPMHDPARMANFLSAMGSGDPARISESFGNGKARQWMLDGSAAMVTHPERTEMFARLLRLLAEPATYPAVMHCSAGKDRTGWGASLVLLALGVPERTVVEHYLESNVHRKGRSALRQRLAAGGVEEELLSSLFDVHSAYFEAKLAAIDAHWGGFDAYLRTGLGVDDGQLARLEDALLEPVAG